MDDKGTDGEGHVHGPRCNVNSTFNYSVGAVSVAVAAALGWLAWRYFAG